MAVAFIAINSICWKRLLLDGLVGHFCSSAEKQAVSGSLRGEDIPLFGDFAGR